MILIARNYVALKCSSKLNSGHGLNPDVPRTGYAGVEKPLASEEHIADPFVHLNIKGAGDVHRRKVAGVEDHGFARTEFILYHRTADLKEHHAAAGEFLHYEALAAEYENDGISMPKIYINKL